MHTFGDYSKKRENETVSNYHQLKLDATDGKMRLTDVADTETQLGHSVISPTKAKDYLKIEES